jgi:hypothetical protein
MPIQPVRCDSHGSRCRLFQIANCKLQIANCSQPSSTINHQPSTIKHLSTVILVTNDGMGTAEAALRHKLIRIYLGILCEDKLPPKAICFYADGVKLVVEGSPVLDLLKQLESQGVPLISCITCLRYYGLAERVKVGVVGGMHDIVTAQWHAGKVITL